MPPETAISDVDAKRAATALTFSRGLTYAAIAYVATVLLVDTLASRSIQWPFDWGIFRWQAYQLYSLGRQQGMSDAFVGWLAVPVFRSFDFFKFLFWFVVPFLFCLWRMDWGYWGVARCKRIDWWLFGVGIALGIVAVLAIPYIPSLAAVFARQHTRSFSARVVFFLGKIVWTISWIVGWEFMHRYFLLRRLDLRWPRWGWVVVPVFEVAYHFWNLPMGAGMLVYSVIATLWVRARKNVLLPFLLHFSIEVALWVFVLRG